MTKKKSFIKIDLVLRAKKLKKLIKNQNATQFSVLHKPPDHTFPLNEPYMTTPVTKKCHMKYDMICNDIFIDRNNKSSEQNFIFITLLICLGAQLQMLVKIHGNGTALSDFRWPNLNVQAG